mmetsp:Transcript_12407/g.20295  ORF Transcript_12407/g.20295 Transcript_12407/m.20295 type:complete len:493 (-) Transcript_12407:365-1843(-)
MARLVVGERTGASFAQESAMTWGGKLQMMQSPTAKGALNSEAVSAFGIRPGFLSLAGSGGKSLSTQRKCKSAAQLEIEAVRGLANDEPNAAEQDANHAEKHSLANLMTRLKSREARAKAENNRDFLAKYRAGTFPGSETKADEIFDKLLSATSERADELRLKSEELQVEAQDLERKLERVTTQSINRATDTELNALNAFERSQKKIQEDKREEELSKLREEAQANYVRVHRRLQNELLELRDYKVLLREFRRLRLEKLQENLAKVQDGRRLRSCVREMIRHGAQKILARLEQGGVPLDMWMREVLVNSCHLELRIEDGEQKLLKLRRHGLGPVKDEVKEMVNASKTSRFEALCARTWEHRLKATDNDEPSSPIMRRQVSEEGRTMNLTSSVNMSNSRKSLFATRVPEDIGEEMYVVEADIAAVKRLLADMRSNSASVICHQIREAEKSGGRAAAQEKMEWGWKMLNLLVNEDFAKSTMKELQKSAPQGKFAF